jgi:hypothetical protein
MASSSRPRALRTTALHPAWSPRVTPRIPPACVCSRCLPVNKNKCVDERAPTELERHPAVDSALAAQYLVRPLGNQPERLSRTRDKAARG